ncbi:hypothetical protein B0E38_04724 [Streptomyces sp. 111WW2]|uniref:hypothetical protein n=1 Tax=Streptomyces sp. 111WW2 TaxID=1945515 RepID=UPI000D0C8838|nr:hypothetical protein [Streptomyces sp. 111WW2]PSK52398.1 hypothetical protein B0E38_04724 [Streptomyces sp. 111WW2]
MTAWTRRHCLCVEVRNLDYDEAAAALKIKADWLRDHIGQLPHQKFGRNAAVFCMCDLRLIQAMQTVMPPEAAELVDGPAPKPADTPEPATSAVPAYAALRPSQGRRREPAGV